MARTLSVTLLAALLAFARAQAPTAAPTSAPTAAPESSSSSSSSSTMSSTTQAKSSSTTSSTTTKPKEDTNSTSNSTVTEPKKTLVEFSLVLTSQASCSDMTPGSAFEIAMKNVGAKLAGGVNLGYVKVACSTARRLTSASFRRLAALAMNYDITLPAAEATAAEDEIKKVTLENVNKILTDSTASTDYSFSVDDTALAAMKASVMTTELTLMNGTWTMNTTTREAAGIEASAASSSAAASFLAMASALAFLLLH
eukprot:TRINITY_DN111076_c0_g1_i1.p1 TRINITY_DN111076_c0_g1~~TRINITY_DN111076_c0_g1_i1.p1  ORF type:complete len:255 (+),score=63.60 TRINITY_DN111076_c0_g1_i1:76-840(+)